MIKTLAPALSIWTEPLQDVHSEQQGPFIKRYSLFRASVDDLLTKFTQEIFPFWKVSVKESFKDPVKKEFLGSWCLGSHLTRLDMYFQIARKLNRDYSNAGASDKFMLTKKYEMVEESLQQVIIDEMTARFTALLHSSRRMSVQEVRSHWAITTLADLRSRG